MSNITNNQMIASANRLLIGLFLLLASTTCWADGVWGPKAEIEFAASELEEIIDREFFEQEVAKSLNNALNHLGKSINSGEWEPDDDFGSVLTENGQKSFSELFKAATDLEDALDEIDKHSSQFNDVSAVLERIFAAACDLPENLILFSTGNYQTGIYHLEEPLISELLESDQPKHVRKAVKYFVEALEEHDEGEVAAGIWAFMRSWRNALEI